MDKQKEAVPIVEKIVFYLVMISTAGLVLFSIWFVYKSFQPDWKNDQPVLQDEVVEQEVNADNIKPLPDFVLDNIQPDELKKLKP